MNEGAVDFSAIWPTLVADKQEALLKLSLFEGTFARELAEKMLGVNVAQIMSLYTQGLLIRSGAARYAMPATVRLEAIRLCRANPELARVLTRRYASYFLKQLSEPVSLTAGNIAEQVPDISAAFRLALAALDLDLLESALEPLKASWLKLGLFKPLAELCAAASLELQESKDARVIKFLASLDGAQGVALYHLGELAESGRLLTAAATSFRALGLRGARYAVLEDLATLAARQKQVTAVKTLALEQLQDCRKARDDAGAADALRLLGRCADIINDRVGTAATLKEAMGYYTAKGDQTNLGWCMNILADQAVRAGDYKAGKDWGGQFLAKASQMVDRSGLVWSHLRVADVEIALGEYASAQERLRRCLAMVDPEKDAWISAFFNIKYADVCLLAGWNDQAVRSSRAGLEAFVKMGDNWGKAWAGDMLGYTLFRSGKAEEGRGLMSGAEAVLRTHVQSSSLLDCLRHQAHERMAQGDRARAKALLAESLQIAFDSGYVGTQLDVIAWVAEASAPEQPELGLELMAFVLSRPQTTHATRKRLDASAAEIGQGKQASALKIIEAQGKNLTLQRALELAGLKSGGA